MNHFDLVGALVSCVGKTFEREGREVKVLSLQIGPIESFFTCVWEDTCMVYCATLYEVGLAIDPDILPKKKPLA